MLDCFFSVMVHLWIVLCPVVCVLSSILVLSILVLFGIVCLAVLVDSLSFHVSMYSVLTLLLSAFVLGHSAFCFVLSCSI